MKDLFNIAFGGLVGSIIFIGGFYLTVGIEDLDRIKKEKAFLENDIRFSKAIILGNSVFRCSRVLSDEGLKNDQLNDFSLLL